MPHSPLGRAARLLVIALATTAAAAGLQAQALPPGVTLPTVPPPPHQTDPDAPLYPDYYALALARTTVTDDPAWRPLHLEAGGAPGVIVLPVQTQAYALAPTLRALAGARLDQELQRRHVDASRQTDIVDWRGPFVRRTDAATIAALAAEHPGAALLALYVGHDAAGHAFVSLARTDGGKQRIAHRRVELSRDGDDTVARLFATLPPLLAELGLGDAKPAAALPAGDSKTCAPADWTLGDLPPDAGPVATACHALVMGSLLPDFMATLWNLSPPTTPDRLAWLARAWVEASALASTHPSMGSAAALAAFQLRMDVQMRDTTSLVDDPDAVVRPLARMFSARARASQAPQVSRNSTIDRYVDVAAEGLPDFAAAVVREHGRWDQEFRTADLCGMQVALPYFAVPRGCDADAAATPRPKGVATRGQRQLLDAWRVAAAWSDLYLEGHMRGSAKRLADVERGIPQRIATHPLIREMRFAVRSTPVAPEDIDGHMARTRSELEDAVQALATLQETDDLARDNAPDGKGMLPAERADAGIARVLDDFLRLQSVQNLERLDQPAWRPDRPGAQLAPFLAEGRFQLAQMAAMQAQRPGGFGPLPTASAQFAGVRKPTLAGLPGQALRPRAELEAVLGTNPFDWESRTQLAIQALEHGQGVAAARREFDARPQRGRVEDTLNETNELSGAGSDLLYAGELDAAREYFTRASGFDAGSNADMLAKMRLAGIAGDVRAAKQQAHAAAVRYQDESFRADEAGYAFMLGEPQEAWALLLPRMQTGTSPGFWRSALAGHRMASTPLAALPDWIARNRLAQASHDGHSYAPSTWLRTYATLDRLPTPADIAQLKTNLVDGKHPAQVTGALVLKTAIDETKTDDPDALARDMQSAWGSDRTLFMPFYEWAVWNASHGKDPALAEARSQSLEAGFAPVLAKAMVLAADGQRDEALRFLKAARYELAREGDRGFEDEFRTAPYDFVLATWLMTRKTGDRAYAEQGLAIARGYQHVTEYLAWPYAAEALLGQDARSRQVAACRAQWLDPGSMFLRESGLHPDAKSAACRQAVAW